MVTGQLSLGNAGFMAIGAYITAMLTVHLHIPLFVALIVAGIIIRNHRFAGGDFRLSG